MADGAHGLPLTLLQEYFSKFGELLSCEVDYDKS